MKAWVIKKDGLYDNGSYHFGSIRQAYFYKNKPLPLEDEKVLRVTITEDKVKRKVKK